MDTTISKNEMETENQKLLSAEEIAEELFRLAPKARIETTRGYIVDLCERLGTELSNRIFRDCIEED